MKSAKKFLSKKMIYRNLAYTGLFAFSLYICYKTYDTQRKIREGNPTDAKKAKDEAMKEAEDACIEECPIEKKDCPSKSDCDKDDADCKKEATDCAGNLKKCKEVCKGNGKGGNKKK